MNGGVFLKSFTAIVKCMLLIVIAALALHSTSARLAAGQEIQKGGYIIDFGYAPQVITAGQPATISVALFNQSANGPEGYDYAFLRIGNSSGSIQSMKLYNDNGMSEIMTTLPLGNYSVSASFYRNNSLIVTGSINITSNNAPLSENGYVISLMYVLLIIFAISIVLVMYMRYSQKKYEEEIITEIER